MKTQFTPGPWKAELRNPVGCNRYHIKSTEGYVALVYDYENSTLQNAALIADAPTLLSVLEKCFITLVGEYPKDQWEEYYPEILEAKALLEKHLGDLGLED